MTYSYLLNSYSRLAALAGGIFSTRRLPAAVALAMALALVSGVLPGAAGPAYAQEKASPAAATVNINTADATALAAGLQGVGTSRAQEIVRYREAYGPFKSVDELTDVKGIGKSTLDDNRARITLE